MSAKGRTFLAAFGLSLGLATAAGQGIPALVITASQVPPITIYDTWRDEKRVI
jgi:hypothetical protein